MVVVLVLAVVVCKHKPGHPSPGSERPGSSSSNSSDVKSSSSSFSFGLLKSSIASIVRTLSRRWILFAHETFLVMRKALDSLKIQSCQPTLWNARENPGSHGILFLMAFPVLPIQIGFWNVAERGLRTRSCVALALEPPFCDSPQFTKSHFLPFRESSLFSITFVYTINQSLPVLTFFIPLLILIVCFDFRSVRNTLRGAKIPRLTSRPSVQVSGPLLPQNPLMESHCISLTT